MKKIISIFLLAIFLFACKKEYKVTMPDAGTWDLFNDPAAKALPAATKTAMEGVYKVTNASDIFGELAAVKWSYVINNGDTTFHVSGFFGTDIAYFICEGRQLNGTILLNGYWRKMVSTETGLVHLTIDTTAGASLLLGNAPVVGEGMVTMDGFYGQGQQEPLTPLTLTYARKLNHSPAPFQIAAHRSGGRTSDLLPVSENSVPMILKTAEFGSTGIEVDVRYTKDGVPVLYHDNTLNLREIQKSGLVGPIENYTYDQLSVFVRLIHGEKIPTLREALTAVVYQTPLTFVWLDTKYVGSVKPVQRLQNEFMQKAKAAGRKLDIVIGLPGQAQFDEFLSLPDYSSTPSLCELSMDDVTKSNALIWAPRFTEGTQNDAVDKIHAMGKKAFVWTVDVPEFITRFVNEGHFDGILSNFPSCVAYNYYVHQ
ncbi:MAG: glycerophosphodiester phosphodiesterase [Ferruginibacter sp.]|uniref:glycerophosphodiester phosphodiesterase n=1 Tax=Ferruginibacter sp. TaxID=1940288 RepID=UPI0026598BFE|nr:glycerophosphodiester phosphodiesterase [Ferruginibacter sp.]MDB5280782.1 glycerophosphodiester phosphodiesterase [Ferruginibacter sp.]